MQESNDRPMTPIQKSPCPVSNGQKADILADGTKVYINSDSRIVYDNTYNKKTRMVSLEGEAYFEVAKDKESLSS